MNTDTVAGKVDQFKGQVKQSVGEATGNDDLANSGTADQFKGNAKEAWGSTKDAAHATVADAKAHAEAKRDEAKAEHNDTAHSVREHVVNASEKVKNFVTGHSDDAHKS